MSEEGREGGITWAIISPRAEDALYHRKLCSLTVLAEIKTDI